jgi:hypothetical protein
MAANGERLAGIRQDGVMMGPCIARAEHERSEGSLKSNVITIRRWIKSGNNAILSGGSILTAQCGECNLLGLKIGQVAFFYILPDAQYQSRGEKQ